MFNTQEQKENYINKLFSDVELFEWDVLHISSNEDRAEIMDMLAENLVYDLLKKDINFLHIKNLDNINLKKIKSSIFSEIINEWLNFCDDVLMYPKDDAILVVKQGQRVKFIYSIVNSYFDKFHRIIFSEMVDTFLEYFNKTLITKKDKIFIEKILQSKLNDDVNSLTLHKFSQLYSRVRIAQDKKNREIKKISNKIKELNKNLHTFLDIDADKKNEILLEIEDFEYDIEELEDKGLYEFDDIIARLRNNMMDAMQKIS